MAIMNWTLIFIVQCLLLVTNVFTQSNITSVVSTTDDLDRAQQQQVVNVEDVENPRQSRWHLADDIQEQLMNQPSTGWTSWSKWSTCSRTCDGGVAHQLRRCNSLTGCHGEPIRYKICNMQPCQDPIDFREQQCSAYNGIPYEGLLYKWHPHHVETDPCALTCRGYPMSVNIDTEEDIVEEEDNSVVVQLAPKVQDGTRCRLGSLDMCINGKCERVGCDLRIGSNKKVDSCGLCGGDGTSCAQPLYQWKDGPFTICSATCGGGFKIAQPLCQNRQSSNEVDEQLCDASSRPDPQVIPCNRHACPPHWIATDWKPCSQSCGGGLRLRNVDCVQQLENGSKVKLDEDECQTPKPHTQEICNDMKCPDWETTQWSGCSVSCGEGLQTRTVECIDYTAKPSNACSLDMKPASTQLCNTGISCRTEDDTLTEEKIKGMKFPVKNIEDNLIDTDKDGDIRVIKEEMDKVEKAPDEGVGKYKSTFQLHSFLPGLPAKAERLVGEIAPSEATFVVGEWGPCSCTEGIRRREVHCKIFLEFSKTLAKLPDDKCSGPKPPEVERCPSERCYGDYPVKPGTYSWKEMGYADCSASCLGGTQEMIIMCINDSNQKPASPFMCSPSTKPEVKVRTCNDHACPPRWNYSEFSTCSKSCGMGIQTREVNCIHEITSGVGNTLTVPNSMCQQPPPPDRQYCNVLDCPIEWEVNDWSKCSKPCGGGFKDRKVRCKQVMAQNHIVEQPDHLCSKPKPVTRRPCNTKSCALEGDRPVIPTTNSTLVQHDVTKTKVTAKVGGSANVFRGITLKVKCPVKKFDRAKIKWQKNHRPLPRSRKYKVSKKGALRIVNLSYGDNGTYTCIAGLSSADLTVVVKPRPDDDPKDARTNRRLTDDSRKNRKGQGRGKSAFDANENRMEDPNLGPSLFADQQEGVARGVADADDSWHSVTPATSSGARAMPHFQELLTNLKTFSNSRGHRMVAANQQEDNARLTFENTNPLEIFESNDEEDLGHAEIIGRGRPDQLRFDWVITDWSQCSLTCGGDGYQVRAANCMLHFNNVTRSVNDNLCEDAGKEKPTTVRVCGGNECPRWMVSDWTDCDKSKCFTWNTAMQKREVVCQTTNGTTLEDVACDLRERPPHRQECFNGKCKGVWKVGEWSECTAACNGEGIKYRILQCVWFGTRKAAGNACKDQIRPPVMKMCKGVACSSNLFFCQDQSKYCKNVKIMNLCHLRHYQYHCCVTCDGFTTK